MSEWFDVEDKLPDDYEQKLVIYEFEVAGIDDSWICQKYGVSKYTTFNEWDRRYLDKGNQGYCKVLRWQNLPNDKLESRMKVYDD